MTRITLAALLLAAAPATLLAAEAGPLSVSDPYVISANGKTGAAFFGISNAGTKACTLTAATGTAAERIELHTHTEVDGVMKMTKIEGGIEVPAGTSHLLERGGDHVMLIGLTKPLKDGDSVALTLDFGACGKLDVTAPVDNARKPGKAPAADAGHGAHGEHSGHGAHGDHGAAAPTPSN